MHASIDKFFRIDFMNLESMEDLDQRVNGVFQVVAAIARFDRRFPPFSSAALCSCAPKLLEIVA